MEIRNVSDLNLDEITEEFLRDQCIEMGAELGVDTNQGSLYRDAAEGHIIRTAKFFYNLSQVNKILSIFSCTGDVLDERLKERGMERNPPASTSAWYYVEFVGAEPEDGDLMSCDDHFGTVTKIEGRWLFKTEETGIEMNYLVPGIPVIPERDVDDLISATLQELATPAVDVEDDDSARERFINMVAGPSENGNKAQIQSWCEGIEGVGRARIIPQWKGDNTVLGIIISTDGVKPSEAVVKLVQDTIDPGAEGMGEGLATIGCHFTAQAAEENRINLEVDISKKAESSIANIQDALKAALTAYLKELSLHSYTDEIVVRYNSIGALIAALDDVVDYDNLKVNGGTENIACTQYQIPVTGEVTANGNL